MRAELVRLQAAFPEFSFGICPGWRGPVFEAWSETGTGDLYAVITSDARELWRELEAGQADQSAAADAGGQERQERAFLPPRVSHPCWRKWRGGESNATRP